MAVEASGRLGRWCPRPAAVLFPRVAHDARYSTSRACASTNPDLTQVTALAAPPLLPPWPTRGTCGAGSPLSSSATAESGRSATPGTATATATVRARAMAKWTPSRLHAPKAIEQGASVGCGAAREHRTQRNRLACTYIQLAGALSQSWDRHALTSAVECSLARCGSTPAAANATVFLRPSVYGRQARAASIAVAGATSGRLVRRKECPAAQAVRQAVRQAASRGISGPPWRRVRGWGVRVQRHVVRAHTLWQLAARGACGIEGGQGCVLSLVVWGREGSSWRAAR